MSSSKAMSKSKSEGKISSGKFGFRTGKKKRHRSRDKMDLEDSGVHFEEPTSSVHSVASELGETDPGVDLLEPGSHRAGSSSPQNRKQTHISPPTFNRNQATSAPDLAVNRRISKSESPQPRVSKSNLKPPEIHVQIPPLAGSGIGQSQTDSALHHCASEVSRSSNLSRYSGNNLEGSGSGPVCFSLGPCDDSDQECRQASDRRESAASKTSRTTKDTRSREKSSNKGRFKKILRPLRRSHSAGSTKDVPAHALFLRHDLEKERRTPPGRRSVDTGRGSMERQSDDSDSDREPSSSSESQPSSATSKTKKKTLAQDMKEKFAFLRRRPDSSKDGKLAKPTKEMIISWAQSFDNLLKDKLGLELFRDFLRTEFSEENVEFWIACEEYRHLKSNKLNARAQEIFTDFVAVQAPREINLDSKTRMETRDLVEKPDRQTFELAQKRIQALMDKDSYPRFLHADVYQKLLADYKIQINIT